MHFRKILIALDNSPISDKTTLFGFGLADALKAEIAIVHVVDTAIMPAIDSGDFKQDIIDEMKTEGKAMLRSVVAKSKKESIREFVAEGNPAESIVQTANEWGADVIVIGTHGRTGLQRFLLGSVAESVVRHAPCAVLVVPPKAEDH